VIAEIAALDEEFEANNIDEDDYNERRDELKRLVLELEEYSAASLSDKSEDESTESEKEQSNSANDKQ